MRINKHEMFDFLILLLHVEMFPKFEVSIISKFPISKHTNKYTASFMYTSMSSSLACKNIGDFIPALFALNYAADVQIRGK
jgi:hypothetical protein